MHVMEMSIRSNEWTMNDAMGGSLEQLITSLPASGTRTVTHSGKTVSQQATCEAVSSPPENR